MNFAKDVKHAKRLVTYLEGIECLCMMCMFVRFFMYGALILWNLSPPFFGFNYVLILVGYVSKWIEVVVTRLDDGKIVVKHIESLILRRYRVS